MNKYTRRQLSNRKRRIEYRLRDRSWQEQADPMLSASNIQYEMAERSRGLAVGGIGMVHLLARRTGLIEAIDEALPLLKRHLPYHESDHVLNIAYNALSGGTCLEDIELRRNDEVYLDAVGAQRIPDPTTEGDFCRRFSPADIERLMEAINEVRVKVWRQQPEEFFDEAILDADGTLAETTGECKQGMDISYKGLWGYHPLVISLANTKEPLYLVNRSGNRPSQEGAAERFDQAIVRCRAAGFRKILLRGDTDFSQTRHLDRWDGQGVAFIFGIDAMPNLVARADALPARRWKRLKRVAKYEVATEPRRRPHNIKEQIVRERGFENIRLKSEQVAEFSYKPGACKQVYRVVVVRKNLSVEKGERRLFDDIRYFFYITNRPEPADQIVRLANQRCDQENLIAQLKNGVRALCMPVADLTSNWAYMVMVGLAWTLKAWFALLLPESGRWAEKYRAEKRAVLAMEFKTFLNAFMRVACQVVRTGRRIVFRLLSWNRWMDVLLRGVAVLRQPLRC
ncbi:MAG: IS1380 family transposase [Acidobacteriota bacterium]